MTEPSSKLRAAMLSVVSEQDIADVVTSLVAAAKSGDSSAAKLLLDRVLGKQSAAEAPRIAIQNNVSKRDPEALERLRHRLLGMSEGPGVEQVNRLE